MFSLYFHENMLNRGLFWIMHFKLISNFNLKKNTTCLPIFRLTCVIFKIHVMMFCTVRCESESGSEFRKKGWIRIWIRIRIQDFYFLQVQTRLVASRVPWQAGLKFGFGFRAVGIGFEIIGMDSNPAIAIDLSCFIPEIIQNINHFSFLKVVSKFLRLQG